MRVWIDLANSPHVLLFRPIVIRLLESGHECWITTRHFAQRIPLAEQLGLEHERIGEHGGRHRLAKAANIAERAWNLARRARRRRYENTPANHIRLPIRGQGRPAGGAPMRCYGLSARRARYYPGTKEDLYLADFSPSATFRQDLGITEDRILITLRPPATMALYHGFENPFFEAVTRHLAARGDVALLVLPRTEDQKASIQGWKLRNVTVP